MVEGILVVPDWNRETHSKLHEIVKSENLVHKERFTVGKPFGIRVDATMDELVDKYGKSAIKTIKKRAERLKANLAFLYCIRGYGKLEVTANYFSLQN